MAPRSSLLTIIGQAGERVRQAQRDGQAAITAVRNDAAKLGRQVSAEAVRTAVRLAQDPRVPPSLRTPLLVAAAVATPKPGARAPAKSAPPRPSTKPVSRPLAQRGTDAREALVEAAMQADAFVRGAADVITFSKADEIAAGLNAAGATALSRMTPTTEDDRSFRENLAAELAGEQRRDAFDKTHRSTARSGGQVAGMGLGLAAGNMGSGAAIVRALPNGSRVVRNAQPVQRLGLDMRGVTRLSAVGGATVGGGGQLAADIARGELSGARDYGAAMTAGTIGGVAGRFGGLKSAAAVTGALTPLSQSLAAGEASTVAEQIDRATHGALGGFVAGRAAGGIGTYGSSALSPKWKGHLGEGLSYAKSIARDGRAPKTQVVREFGKRKTIADQELLDGLLEAKFGRWAKLSAGQKAALRALGAKYIIDHYLPRDVGRIVGVGAAVGAAGRAPDERGPPQH